MLKVFVRFLLVRWFDDECRKTNADETFWNTLREVWLKVNASDSGTTGRCATSPSTLRMRQPQLGDRNAEETCSPIRTGLHTKGFLIGPKWAHEPRPAASGSSQSRLRSWTWSPNSRAMRCWSPHRGSNTLSTFCSSSARSPDVMESSGMRKRLTLVDPLFLTFCSTRIMRFCLCLYSLLALTWCFFHYHYILKLYDHLLFEDA